MTSTELKAFAPLSTTLPPLKDNQILTDAQWATLMAVADAIIPSIRVSSELSLDHFNVQTAEYSTTTEILRKSIPGRNAGIAESYLNERPSTIPEFKELLSRILSDHLRDEALKGVRTILYALESVAFYMLSNFFY